MNVKDENICRLCFKTAENEFQMIDDVIRKMLDCLSLEMNLNISEYPVICKNCIKILSKSYCFKSVCLATEKQIDFFAVSKEEIKFDLNDVNEHKEQATIVKRDSCICRFCLTQLKTSNFVSIDVLMKEASLQEKLAVCMPEMDLNIIKNAVICGLYRENLDSCFNFIQNCLDIEEKINSYLQDKAIVNDVEVKISDIQAFLFENGLDIEKYTAIKQEPPTFDEKEYVYLDTYNESIKTEQELNIKHEVTLNDNLSPTTDTYNEDTYEKNNENTQSHGSNVKRYKCVTCTYETRYKSTLNRHVVTHKTDSIRNIKCEMCTYKTRDKRNLTRHMLVHRKMSEVNTFNCADCRYKTKYKECLKRHMVRHHVSYKCLRCAFEADSKSALRNHIVLLHGDKVVKYKCSTCPFETNRKDYFNSHILDHERTLRETMYKCTMCSFEAKRKDQLKIHKLLHDP